MSSVVHVGLSFLFLSCLNFISVDCVQCYGCHGEYCNDPFNKDRATLVNCSYNSRLSTRNTDQVTGEITNSKFQELESLEAKLMSLFFNKNTEYVCVKSAYYNSVHQTKMTVRRCMPKSSWNMDACGQLSNIINKGYGTVENCMSCDTNLCNSATSMTSMAMTIFLFFCVAKSVI